MTDYKKFVDNSRKWLAKYIEDNHLQSIIIGISGGIDSTISCAIAYPVCKKFGIPLIGRSLSTFTNKEIETNVANLVGDAFCNDYKEVNLEAIYKEFNNLLFAEEYNINGDNNLYIYIYYVVKILLIASLDGKKERGLSKNGSS